MSERDIWKCANTGNSVVTPTMIGALPCRCQGCRASARVAELETQVTFYRSTADANIVLRDELKARVAELEAALRKLGLGQKP